MNELSVKDVAMKLGCTADSVRHYIHSGYIRAYKKGKFWRILEKDVPENKPEPRQCQYYCDHCDMALGPTIYYTVCLMAHEHGATIPRTVERYCKPICVARGVVKVDKPRIKWRWWGNG
tara:strand:+ start:89 stop:445 length:357 start_codon:yes stop_codon:yes gene_type:complete